MKKKLAAQVLVAAAALSPFAVSAQSADSYPARPVRILVSLSR